MAYVEALKAREVIADKTDTANEQHYEVSPRFLRIGPTLEKRWYGRRRGGIAGGGARTLRSTRSPAFPLSSSALFRDSLADLETVSGTSSSYQVSTPFILSTLGPRAKYSASIFPSPTSTLGEAEEYTFQQYALKAKLPVVGEDEGEGWEILDLGCGWGSLGLWLAEVSEEGKAP